MTDDAADVFTTTDFPLTTQNTTANFTTADLNETFAQAQVDRPPIADFYELSYMFVGTVGFLVTLISGILISLASGWQKPAELKDGLYVRWLPCLRDSNSRELENIGARNQAYTEN